MKKSLFIFLALLLASSCAEKVDSPKQVAEKYWNALRMGDPATARELVSSDTQQNLDVYLAHTPDQRTIPEEIHLGDEQTTIATVIFSKNADSNIQRELETVLIYENGQWKVDAARTQMPILVATNNEEVDELAKQLSDSMQENIETMDDAVTEGMHMLNETLEDGSKEMGESLLKLMNELNSSMQESIDKMKQRREQQKQQTQPDPDQGEGMI